LQKHFYKNKEERFIKTFLSTCLKKGRYKNGCSNKNKNSKIKKLMGCKNLFIKTKKRDFQKHFSPLLKKKKI
jgi:hypothetical protein